MSQTILLIEDNEKNRYLATYLLEEHGYKVVHAPDGPRGIAVAKPLLPDLIVLDIQLPVMDGHAVARALREIEQLRAVPIIAVTSFAMVGDRDKALAAGCNGYIEKPINPETFAKEIARFGPPMPATEGIL
jgi:two-component system cell cycle response regulator DivK